MMAKRPGTRRNIECAPIARSTPSSSLSSTPGARLRLIAIWYNPTRSRRSRFGPWAPAQRVADGARGPLTDIDRLNRAPAPHADPSLLSHPPRIRRVSASSYRSSARCVVCLPRPSTRSRRACPPWFASTTGTCWRRCSSRSASPWTRPRERWWWLVTWTPSRTFWKNSTSER